MNYDKWDMVKKKGVNDDDELNGGEIRKEVFQAMRLLLPFF